MATGCAVLGATGTRAGGGPYPADVAGLLIPHGAASCRAVRRAIWHSPLAVSPWKPHPLAGDARPQLDLSMGDRVGAIVDLPDVPAGTKGKVIVADGLAWLRYTVRFDNGVEHTFLDGRHIEPLKKSLFRRK